MANSRDAKGGSPLSTPGSRKLELRTRKIRTAHWKAMERYCVSSCGKALTTADESAAYNEREDRYQREFSEHFEAASLAKSAKVRDSKTDSAKIGSKFAKL